MWQIDHDDAQETETTILPQEPSPYAGGIFFVSIIKSPEFPFYPPLVVMNTRIFHPNITADDGRITTTRLTIGWQMETSPEKIVKYVAKLIDKPEMNPRVVGNWEAYELFLNDPEAYREKAKEWTERFAN